MTAIAAGISAFLLAGYAYRLDGKTFDKIENVIYVSSSASAYSDKADGSMAYPFSNIQEAVDNSAPGTEIIISEGVYAPFEICEGSSGMSGRPTMIRAAKNARPVVKVPAGSAMEDAIGINMENVSHICIDGLDILGGTHGIYYECNTDSDRDSFSDITIRNCRISEVNGVHGIGVYAENDRIPLSGLVIENCEVYNCRCGDSESVVINGNIDGFEIRNNIVHDNNNIGIDMIGFEGTALHDALYEGNRYDADFVRNGKCYGNRVFNISSAGNDAYLENGQYSLSAGGIYVDGGQNIDIFDNEISNCDIGIEVATEHDPKENKLFQVSSVNVYRNKIVGCSGFAGLAFGGYDSERGFTVGCHFYQNTLIDNSVQIAVQRSKSNEIDQNVIIGGDTVIEYNDQLPKSDMVNSFHDNIIKQHED